jgi:NADH-quinone oxidoreductase subunit E
MAFSPKMDSIYRTHYNVIVAEVQNNFNHHPVGGRYFASGRKNSNEARDSMGNTETKPKTDAPQDAGNIIDRVDKVLASYTKDKANLIPILQQVQLVLGYLPEEALSRIARYVGVAECSVFGVATFYAQFQLIPRGRNIVRVCRGTGCYVKGAPRIIEELEKLLKIKEGETTPDKEYTLETVACFGSCALAPVMVVNDKVYGRMTAEKAKEILGRKS